MSAGPIVGSAWCDLGLSEKFFRVDSFGDPFSFSGGNIRHARAVHAATAAISSVNPTIFRTRRRLWARAVRLNSPRTFSRPRIRNAPRSIHCLIDPNGCSTVSRRRARTSGALRQARLHPIQDRLVLETRYRAEFAAGALQGGFCSRRRRRSSRRPGLRRLGGLRQQAHVHDLVGHACSTISLFFASTAT